MLYNFIITQTLPFQYPLHIAIRTKQTPNVTEGHLHKTFSLRNHPLHLLSNIYEHNEQEWT